MQIKYLIFRIFFRNYHELLMNKTDEIFELKNNIKKLNGKIKHYDEHFKMINELGDSGYKVIGIEKNKDDETLIVYLGTSNYEINITGYGYRRGVKPSLYASKVDDTLHIDDIHAINEGVGNGSILMKYMLRQAEKNRIKKITGLLSYVDRDHFDILEKFYEKHGFVVNFNKNKTEGWIEQFFS